jgi:environmental stress-induced protein Ves
MPVHVLTADGYRVVPWRNGLGVSRDVARDAAGDRIRWMLSLTTIARDCPFSDYRGYDRVLTPLGAGVVLTVGDAPPARIAPLSPFAFPGDAAVDCRLEDGPVAVVNAMVDRGWGSQQVALHRGAIARLAVAAPVMLLHAAGGSAAVRAGGARAMLGPGDSLRLDAMEGAVLAIAADAATVTYAASFRPHDLARSPSG